jgi:hypothetical protein
MTDEAFKDSIWASSRQRGRAEASSQRVPAELTDAIADLRAVAIEQRNMIDQPAALLKKERANRRK